MISNVYRNLSTIWIPKQSAISSKAFIICLFTCLIISAITETLRHFSFLIDDNLYDWYPIITAEMHSLNSGDFSFKNDFSLSGSTYYTSYYPLNPLIILLNFLGFKGCYILEAFGWSLILLNALCMTWCCSMIRYKYKLDISDYRLVSISLCYTFSLYNISFGQSWVQWLAGSALIPLLFTGCFIDSNLIGTIALATALIFNFQAGAMHMQITLTCFVLGIGIIWFMINRDSKPIIRILIAFLIFAITSINEISDFALEFSSSSRSKGIIPEISTDGFLKLSSIFFGSIIGPNANLIVSQHNFGYMSPTYFCSFSYLAIYPVVLACTKLLLNRITFCFGLITLSICAYFQQTEIFIIILIGLVYRAKIQNPQLKIYIRFIGILLALSIFFVARPDWLQNLTISLPVFRAMRWSCREVIYMQFFLSIFILIYIQRLSRTLFIIMLSTGILFAIEIEASSSFPTLGYYSSFDREIIISGKAFKYWEQIKMVIPKERRLLPVVSDEMWDLTGDARWTLLGSHSFPCLFRFKAVNGYTSFKPGFGKRYPYSMECVATPEEANNLMKLDPSIILIELISKKPYKIHIYGEDFSYWPDLAPYIDKN